MNDELLQTMSAAFDANDDDRFYRLCDENAQWIEENWEEWSRASPEQMARFQTDADEMRRHGQFFFAVARRLDLVGHRGPMDRIRGVTGFSPVVRFDQALNLARQQAENGDHEACRATLRAALDDLTGLTGAEQMRAQAHVELALCAARMHDLTSAAEHIRTAREQERAAGDLYFPFTTPYFDTFTLPELGPLRDAIAHAQLLSDNGDYAASNAELLPLLDGAGHYLAKVQGLLGLNHHRLGDQAKAEEFTSAALAQCERRGDATGVEIYTANLRTIRTPGTSGAPR